MSILSRPTVPVTDKLGHRQEHLPKKYSLDDLVRDVKAYLGDSNGIASSDVDSNYLISLVKKYEASDGGWTQFYHNDLQKNYTRNAIENINHKANIVSNTFASESTPINSNEVYLIAPPRMEPTKGLAHPRPRQRPLHHESAGRQLDRNSLYCSRDGRRQCWPSANQVRDNALSE